MEEKKEKPKGIDLNTMTDKGKLKEMAYDIMKNIAIYQRELQMIENKINQLEKNAVQM